MRIRRLAEMRIGARLRLAFICVMTLTLLGSVLSLWQFREVKRNAGEVAEVGQRLRAVLELHNGLLRLMSTLHRAADRRQPEFFQSEAERLTRDFRSGATGLREALSQRMAVDTKREILILDSLTGLLDAMPARVDALETLARAGDWAALHARLANEVDQTDDVVSALVLEMNTSLSAARLRLFEDLDRAQRRTTRILAATTLFSLAVAAFLGLAVTRSITRPLANLAAAARALAHGEFGHTVTTAGSDELTGVAEAFNRMAGELKDLYAETQRSEAHFRALIEKASDLILVVSEAGKLMYSSPSSALVLGRTPGNLAGRPIRDLVHPEEAAQADRMFRVGSLAPGSMRPFEWRFRCEDGSFRVLEGLASNLLGDPAVRGIVVNARDVSERRQAEQVLRDRDDQLRQAQKMEAIGQLAGGVAHDFNNLLTAINGYSDLMLGMLPAADPSYMYAKEIQDAGLRAADLTRQLLAFSRRQVLQPAIVDLNETVKATGNLLRRVIGEDVELVCKLDPALGAVRADPSQMHQVLMNLALNSRDAMPKGGRLTIETSNADAGRAVLLTVADTGNGMDSATQQRVFEPFFTTKETGKGTGLGLSIVYGIVRQSNGRIEIESDPGAGTVFRIYLPRVEAAPRMSAASKKLTVQGGTETILLVEDQTEVRRFASTSLRSYGYRVIEAATGEEALRLHNEATEPIHVVLTDVVMPGMTGVELSAHLQSASPGVKVIFASGYADSVILRHGVLDVGIAFLQKPYSPAALAAKVRETLGPAGEA